MLTRESVKIGAFECLKSPFLFQFSDLISLHHLRDVVVSSPLIFVRLNMTPESFVEEGRQLAPDRENFKRKFNRQM